MLKAKAKGEFSPVELDWVCHRTPYLRKVQSVSTRKHGSI